MDESSLFLDNLDAEDLKNKEPFGDETFDEGDMNSKNDKNAEEGKPS